METTTKTTKPATPVKHLSADYCHCPRCRMARSLGATWRAHGQVIVYESAPGRAV